MMLVKCGGNKNKRCSKLDYWSSNNSPVARKREIPRDINLLIGRLIPLVLMLTKYFLIIT